MTDNPTAAEQDVDQASAERHTIVRETPAFRWPVVSRRTAQALDVEAQTLAAEAEHWFARYTAEGDRATKAEGKAADAEERADRHDARAEAAELRALGLKDELRRVREQLQQVEESREWHLAECIRLQQLAGHLQKAGRDITAAFTAEDQAAEPMLDAIGRVLIKNAHRFDLGREDLADIPWVREPEAQADEDDAEQVEDAEQAELLRAAFRYPHDSTEPAIIADHLPHCEACTKALPTLDVESLTLAYRYALHSVHWRAVAPLQAEGDRRKNRTKENPR